MTRFLAILTACLLAQACASHAESQRRNDAMFDRIQPGMTREEVRGITGAPDNSVPFALSGNTSWGYYYWDQFGYYVEFSVTFAPDGHVLSKTYRRVNDGGEGKH
jgi:outer membrane protein assembly factor BamE (lipoprotein component of BamABCDE complex)